jgi:hypothetical protein
MMCTGDGVNILLGCLRVSCIFRWGSRMDVIGGIQYKSNA